MIVGIQDWRHKSERVMWVIGLDNENGGQDSDVLVICICCFLLKSCGFIMKVKGVNG
jgi:hypothetical protein